MTATRDALCCAFTAVTESAADAGAEPFEHVYPSAAMTWPYCDHHFVTGRSLPPTTLPPPGSELLPSDDPQTTGRIYFHRFELDVGRCGPPAPTTGCLGDLYGDCASPAGHSTLAGHEAAVDTEISRLFDELLDRWCDCMTATIPGYAKHAPRWIESNTTIETQGRFSVIRFQIGTRLG